MQLTSTTLWHFVTSYWWVALLVWALAKVFQFDFRFMGWQWRSFRPLTAEEREARRRGCNCGSGERVKVAEAEQLEANGQNTARG